MPQTLHNVVHSGPWVAHDDTLCSTVGRHGVRWRAHGVRRYARWHMNGAMRVACLWVLLRVRMSNVPVAVVYVTS